MEKIVIIFICMVLSISSAGCSNRPDSNRSSYSSYSSGMITDTKYETKGKAEINESLGILRVSLTEDSSVTMQGELKSVSGDVQIVYVRPDYEDIVISDIRKGERETYHINKKIHFKKGDGLLEFRGRQVSFKFHLVFMDIDTGKYTNFGLEETENGNACPVSGMNTIRDTYYSGQNERPFEMLQKHIFENTLVSWSGGAPNPRWNFETFARYHVLNSDMVPGENGKELYYCTYTADEGQYGYVVLLYDGDSLSCYGSARTPYLYDLQANMDKISQKLAGTEIDTATATASRVSLVHTEINRTDEAILVTDDSGHRYICYFADLFESR